MISRQRRSIPMLPISSPGAAKEPGLRPCGWEAHDEEGLGDEEARGALPHKDLQKGRESRKP